MAFICTKVLEKLLESKRMKYFLNSFLSIKGATKVRKSPAWGADYRIFGGSDG